MKRESISTMGCKGGLRKGISAIGVLKIGFKGCLAIIIPRSQGLLIGKRIRRRGLLFHFINSACTLSIGPGVVGFCLVGIAAMKCF